MARRLADDGTARAAADAPQRRGAWVLRVLRRIVRAVLHLGAGLLLAWALLAIWFSPLPWSWLRLGLAAGFGTLGVGALWGTRTPHRLAMFAAALLLVCIGWSMILPTHEREWRPEVAVMPSVQVEGDRVRLSGVRDFEYFSRDDFVPRYTQREVRLSKLTGIDLYISYWMRGPIGHTFLSFLFEDADPISVSIEARPERHEGYAPVASLFKQFELIYVVGEERDIVGVRTNHRGEDVYRYRIVMTPQSARELFMVYAERINELAAHAEFYHLLSNNCTINVVRYARAVGAPTRFDFRHYLNGLIDGYLYQMQRLDTSLPFQELRRRAHINAVAQAAGGAPDSPQRIRAPAEAQ